MPVNNLNPLTPSGVSARLTELYALGDALLAAQASEVQLDLREWLDNNFALTTAQEDYLEMMDDDTIFYLSEQIAFCFINRLPVTFIKPEPPGNPGLGKWVESTSSIKTSSNINEGLTVSGGFQIKIVYQS